MPPHASLSPRDGRSDSSTAQGRDSHYYSNEDIEILHEVVSRGEEILPTLPERDRLPTNALFRAADIVLPRHGLDPDEDEHLSRVIFKVGGIRGPERLLDKFRSVLGKMDIELEFVNPAETPRALSVHSADPSSSGNATHSGTFPISEHLNGRRRRNSDSVAQGAVEDNQDETYPRRRRSVSFAPSQDPGQEVASAADARQQRVDPWLSQVHRFTHDEDAENAPPAEVETKELELPYRPRVHPALQGTQGRAVSGQKENLLPGNDVARHSTALPPQPNAAGKRPQRHLIAPAGGLDTDLGDAPQPHVHAADRKPLQAFSNGHFSAAQRLSGLDNYHEHARESRHQAVQAMTATHQRAASPSVGTRSDVSQDSEVPFSPSGPLYGPTSERSRSPHSEFGSERLREPSDTTVQEEMDGPQPKTDLSVMAKTADALYLRSLVVGSFASWRRAYLEARAREEYAVSMDKEMSASEAILMWSEQAGTLVHDDAVPTQTPEEASGEETPQGGYLNNYREKIMQRAGRAYELSIMHKAFTHWQALADEEAERTEIARRHLLRMKFFGAWRQQNTTDEERVRIFAMTHAFRRWTEATSDSIDEQLLAIQLYDRAVVAKTYWVWFRRHQVNTADLWRVARLKEMYVQAWGSQTQAMIDIRGAAGVMAEDAVLDAALRTWKGEVQQQIETVRQVERRERRTVCRSAFQDWAKLALLEDRLAKFRSSRDRRLKATAVSGWRQETMVLCRQEERLALDYLRDCTRHWSLEAKLATYVADYEAELKSRVVYDWMLEERLSLFVQYREEELVRKTFTHLGSALREEQSATRQLGQAADRLDKQHAMSGLVAGMREQQQDLQNGTQAADMISFFHQSTSAFGALDEGVVDHGEMEALAERGAYYVTAANALAGWADYAKQVRQERLRTTYHRFRRKLKRSIASDCMSVWIAGTDECLAAGWEADGIRTANDAHELVGTMNFWIAETNDKLVQQSIAEEAHAELYLNTWRLQLDKYHEDAAEASEYDVYTQLKGRFEDWELQSVQVRGRQHTATELQEKNNRRTLRHVVGAWREAVVPREEQEDLQSSFLSRNSVRRSTVRRLAPSTPLGPTADFDGDQEAGPSQRFGSSLLQPITEYDEDQSVLGSRFRPIGPQPPGLAERTRFAQRFATPQPRGAPSSSGPGEGSALFNRFRTPQFRPDPQPAGGSVASGRPSGLRLGTGAASLPQERTRQRFAQPPPQAPPADEETVPRSPAPRRLSSLQQRLDEATRIADSVQLGPMSDFDDDDEAEEDRLSQPTLPDRRGLAATAPPRFMDTPTKWTGIAALQRNNPAAAAGAATTTPMAPLPSPYERQLRQQYGGRGGGGLARGGSRFAQPSSSSYVARQTPRVTFAEVRDEADESEAG